MTNGKRESARLHKQGEAIKMVLDERKYQRTRWPEEHDTTHSLQDWLTLLTYYQGRAAYSVAPHQENKAEFRKRVKQLAAICLAALEATS